MNEIRTRLLASRNSTAILEELEAVVASIEDKQEKSQNLYTVGQAYEEVLLSKNKAMVNYQKAFKLYPQDPLPLTRARNIYREMGNLNMVAKLMEFQTKLVSPEDRAVLLKELAMVCLDLGRPDKARAHLLEAAKHDADAPELQLLTAALDYEDDSWQEQVNNLLQKAEEDEAHAATLILTAARIHTIGASDDPFHEELLRKVVELDPDHAEANYLLEAVMADGERAEELREYHMERLGKASFEQREVLLRDLANKWSIRFSDADVSGTFYSMALDAHYQYGEVEFPGHLAAFQILRKLAKKHQEQRPALLKLADKALDSTLPDDEKGYVALEAAEIAWLELEEPQLAAPYFDRVQAYLGADEETLREFLADYADLMPQVQAAGGEEAESEDVEMPALVGSATLEDMPAIPDDAADQNIPTAGGETIQGMPPVEDMAVAEPAEESEEEPAEVELEAVPEQDMAASGMELESALLAEEESAPPEIEMEAEPQAEAEPEEEPEAEVEPEPAEEPEAEAEPEPEEEPEAEAEAEPEPEEEPEPEPAEEEEPEVEAEPEPEPAEEAEAEAEEAEEAEPEPEPEPDPEAEHEEEPAPEPMAAVEIPDQVDEDLDEETAAMFAAAAAAESQSPEKGIDAWRKAAQRHRNLRTPRRALYRLYTQIERWNALVEVIKEEVELIADPGEKVALLRQMVAIYRDQLGLDVMVVSGLNQIVKIDPNNLVVLDELATQYEKMKRWTDLIATLKKKADLAADPVDQVEIWTRVANLFVQRFSNQAEAIKAYEKIIGLDPTNPEALSNLKQMYERRRDWDKLISVYQKEIDLLDDASEKAARTMEVAELASTKLRRPKVSQELWGQVLVLDPDNAKALAQLETLYERAKDWENLADVCQRQIPIIDDDDRKVQILQKLGSLYTDKVKDSDKAIEAWKALLTYDTNNRRAQDTLKKLYLNAGDFGALEEFYASQNKWDEFIRVLERQEGSEDAATRIELNFKIANLWQEQLSKPDRAIRAYEKILSLDDSNLEAAEALIPLYEGGRDVKKYVRILEIQLAHTEEADLKLDRIRVLAELAEGKLRDKGRAFDWYLQALEVDAASEWVREDGERLAGETGRWSDLVNAYEQALEATVEPVDRLPLMLTVARVYEEELTNDEQALRVSAEILELEPQNVQAVEALVRLYSKAERYSELLEVFQRKIDLVDDDEERKEIYFRIAYLYEEEIGDAEQAINAYRTVLDLAGDDAKALKSLDRIYENQQMWRDLAEVLLRQLNMSTSEEAGELIGLKFRLAMLQETQLEDVASAIDNYRDILDLEPQHEGARAGLEKHLASESFQLDAARILEPIYQQLSEWHPLVNVFEIMLSREDDPANRIELLLRIGELHVDKVGDGEKAFDAYSRCFKEQPENEQARGELERLADIQDSWESLAGLYEEATSEALDAALQLELLMTLASIMDDRLEQPERAVEFFRRAQEFEPDNPATLEALEKLYTRGERWSDLLEVFRRRAELTSDSDEREELYFQMAGLYEDMLGDMDEAINTYREILVQSDANERALSALDRLYTQQENWAELSENLSRQLELTQDNAHTIELLLRLAALRERQLNEIEAAVETYRRVLELDPTNDPAVEALEGLIPNEEHQLAVAQILEPIYKISDDWRKLVGIYEIMVIHSFDPASKIELLHRMGKLYEVDGDDVRGAFEVYGRALREDPANEDSQERIEHLSIELQCWEDLVAIYNELVVDVMDEVLATALHMKVANIFEHNVQDLDRAAEAYNKIVAIDPQNIDAVTALELIYMRTEAHQDLVDVIMKRVEIVLDPEERKQLLFRAAQIFDEMLQNPDESIRVYQMVLDIDDSDARAMDSLENLYLNLERWEPLKDLYMRKVELAGTVEEKKEIYYSVGEIHVEQLADLDSAIETYINVLDLDGEDLRSIGALDELYRRGERWDDLLQILERQVELSGSTSTDAIGFKHRIGKLWEGELSDLARAVETYREVLSIDPNHADTLVALDALAHGEEEAVIAAQVLEPIYESAFEWERLIDLLEVMIKHSDDPYRTVELLHRIAGLNEQQLDNDPAAFSAFSRALQTDSNDDDALNNLERLAERVEGGWDSLAQLMEQELDRVLDADRQVQLGLRVARIYEEELGQPAEAIGKFRQVLDLEADSRPAIKSLDRLYTQGEDWTALAEILQREIQMAESEEDILGLQFRLGQTYQDRLGDTAQAIDCYRDILAASPEHSPSITSLELLIEDGKHEGEIAEILEPLYRVSEQWDRLVSIMEVQLQQMEDMFDRVQALQRIAEIFEQRLGDHSRAFEAWGRAFAQDPFSEVAGEELERLAKITDGWEDLARVYGMVIEGIEPEERKRILMMQARVYEFEIFDRGRAEESYLSVLQIDEMDSDALESLDRIYTQSSTFEALAAILRKRIEITDSTDEMVELRLRLGDTYEVALEDFDSAVESYTNVLDLDSRNSRALDALERLYFAREQWAELYDIYERMIDIAPGDAGVADCYAHMAKISSDALDDADRAQDLWNRVLDLRGEDPTALWALADLYETAEDYKELVDVLARQVPILTEGADQIRIYKRLGYIWGEKLNRDRNALENWQNVLAIDPGDQEALYAIANIYRNTQAWEELVQTLHRLIELGITTDMPEEELAGLYTQLAELEGDIMLRPQESIDAWRKVLQIDDADLRAMGALEQLLTQEARWEECIQVLQLRAGVLAGDVEKIDVLLQVAAIWQEKVENNDQAAGVYEEIMELDEAHQVAYSALVELYSEGWHWEKLIELYMGRTGLVESEERVGIFQQMAQVYEEKLDSPDEAFLVLQAAFQEDYTNDETASNFERLASSTDRWNDLLQEYNNVVQEMQDPVVKSDLLVKMGKWYGSELGHMDYAIASVQQALQINPECVKGMEVLAGFYRQGGRWAELVKVMKGHAELEEDPDKKAELLIGLAELYEDQLAEQSMAISAYRAALDVNESNGEALNSLERLYRTIEQWDSLIEILGRKADITEEVEEVIGLRHRIGQLYADQLNDTAQAIESYKEVLTIEPQNLEALRALELLYERTEQTEDYLDVLEQQLDIVTTEDDQVSLYQRMAAVWEEKWGKLDRAADCLEKVLEISPQHVPTYQNLERLYRTDSRFDDLVDALSRHIGATNDPGERIDLYMAMAQVYEASLQDPDRAIEGYTDVLSFNPDHTHALDALARLYEQIEAWERAVDVMERLNSLVDDQSYCMGILFRLGRIAEEQTNDAAGAEEYYQQVLAIEGTHAEAMTHLVELYKLRGDWAKAASMMVRAEAHTANQLEKARLLYEAGAAFYQQLDDEGQAAELFARCLAVDPDHQQAGEPLARIYYRDGRYQEVEPILDMLVRKADRRDNKTLQDLYFRLANTSDSLEKHDKALKYYRAAYDIDSTHLPTLTSMAALLFRLEDWDRAFKIYQTILVHHRDSQQPEEIVDIYYRLGTIKLKLGERKKAINMLEKALEIDGTHRPTLESVIELQAKQNDWEAVITAKRSLMAQADEAERFTLLDEIGDIYHERLGNTQKACTYYEESIQLQPDCHESLHKLLELYTESSSWKQAVDIMSKLAELETDDGRRSKYLYTAAVVYRDEVKSLDDAVTYFNRALDHNVELLKAFEAIDRITTQMKDWKQLERNYRKMIKRLPQDGMTGLKVMLWHNLGEIYRSRMQDFQSAATAFEVAANLDPDNLQRHEILAELYQLSGPDYAQKAVSEHQILIKNSPFKFESYKALRRIYMDSRQYDKAWCLCSTLSFLKKADPEEQQFYEQYRQRGFVQARTRLTDEIWHRYVFHREEDRYIGAIFATVAPIISAMTARPHKQYRLKRKDRRDLATDQLLFSKVFSYVVSVLGIVTPELYLRPDQQTGLVMAHTTEVPSFVVGSDLLQGRPEKELAFAISKQLSFIRPEHFLRNVLGAPSQLKTVFFSALKLVQPNFPVPPADIPAVDKTLKYMAGKLHPAQAEQLAGLVAKFAQAQAGVDLSKWWTTTELTANRAGFLLCNDLEVAARMISLEPAGIGAMTPKEKVKDLVLYSISEDYFQARQHLGMVIGQ